MSLNVMLRPSRGKIPAKMPKGRSEFRVVMQRASSRKSAEMFITMIGECIQRRAGAPAVPLGWWSVFWPTPSVGSDLSRCLPGRDEVVQRKAKVRLEDEEDLDKVFELIPTGGGTATKSVDDGGSHDEGSGRGG